MTVHSPLIPAAVVFDLDGVLLESEHLWEEFWTRYAARLGVTWTPADTGHVQGMSAPEWSAYLADRVRGNIRRSPPRRARGRGRHGRRPGRGGWSPTTAR